MSRWKNSPWEFILLYEELDLNMVKVGRELSTSTTTQKKKKKRKKERKKELSTKAKSEGKNEQEKVIPNYSNITRSVKQIITY